ncbi:hypothetical protein Lal_00047544 [Lupinus albus]|nr:hypothetical protein Lal_00047544 [Lupinus albus]
MFVLGGLKLWVNDLGGIEKKKEDVGWPFKQCCGDQFPKGQGNCYRLVCPNQPKGLITLMVRGVNGFNNDSDKGNIVGPVSKWIRSLYWMWQRIQAKLINNIDQPSSKSEGEHWKEGSYSEGFTEAIKADNEEDIEQFNKRTVKAPSEAEAQCAALCKAGKASSYLLRACKQGASYKLK